MADSIANYAELKTALTDFLERDDLADYVDYFIDLAEARFKRELRFREIRERATFTLTEGSRYVDLPADYNDIKFLRLQVPNATSGRMFFPDVDYVAQSEMQDLVILDECRPDRYTIWEQIEFNAPADQDYTGEIFYYTTMDALDDTNTSNELLAVAADVYLFGSLSATAVFLQEDERLAVWEGLYSQGRDSLNKAERDHDRPGPLVSRPANVPKARRYKNRWH